jgi:D-alanine-D-alanine ligase
VRVAVLANLKDNAPNWEGMSSDQWDDLDSPKTIKSILDALESGGHEAAFFEAQITPPHNLIENLNAFKPDLCFNIAEGHYGDGREAHIPSLLEMLRIPYTGSKVLTLALALDKPMTKRVLAYHGLPTPDFQVFERADDPIDDDLLDEREELRYPMFVKPSREGTGMGVSAESVVTTVGGLREQIDKQLARYNQPILCERYIEGRELTVGIVGNLGPTTARRINERTAPNTLPETLTCFPPLEVNLAEYDPAEGGLYTNRIKVELAEDFYYLCPAPLEPGQQQELFQLAAAVFRVTGCKDVGRVDFRLDENDGQPYILEINPLPGLNPHYSDLCVEAKAAGWSYGRLINTIVDLAVARASVGSYG